MDDALKDQPKGHDEAHAAAQAGADAGVQPDRIGALDEATASGRVIRETASAPGKLNVGPNEAGLEGTGHSTLHVTGAPQLAEQALQANQDVAGQALGVGCIVLYREGDYEVSAAGGGTNPEGTNGTREHPALVTRVWPNGFVNLHVFFDGMPPQPRMTVMPEGSTQKDVPEGVQVSGGNACWYWPGDVPPPAPPPGPDNLDASGRPVAPAPQDADWNAYMARPAPTPPRV